MFEKLLSLLPYNPGLIHQMSFYSRRMREEAAIRRTGLIFIVLAFFIQFFAVLSPPQSTTAGSSNDIINGGFSSKAEARAHCIRDTQGFQRIMHYYGISCKAFDAADAETLTIKVGAQNYYSVGRNPSAGKDTPVNIGGAGKLYWRQLSDVNLASEYQVIRLRNLDNKVFYMMYNCGNLVSVGIPQQAFQDYMTGEPGNYVPAQTPTTPTTPPPPPPTTPVTPPPPPPPTTPSTPKPQTPTTTTTTTPCPYNPSLPANSSQCYIPCEYNPLLPANDSKCRPCDKSVSTADALACIDVRKTASNITVGLADANNSTAKAGDTITYTLFAENKGKATVKGFTFQENLNDVLDYADVLNLHGGTMGADKIVVWPGLDIGAGTTATRQITVRVKNPIPQTPVSSSDAAHFDLIMTNVYGNAVNIKLPGSPAKSVEVAAAKLPNTGPGETLAAIAGIVMVGGYFYGRSRLLARESELAIKETVA